MPCLTQIGDGDGADAPALALEVGQDPAAFPLLDGRDVELGQFVPPVGAADQKRQDHVIPFALNRRAVGDSQQLFGLLAGQPVPQPGALLANVGDVGQVILLHSHRTQISLSLTYRPF